MDILAGSVPPGPNITGGMEPGMNTSIYTEFMKRRFVCIFRNIFSLSYFKNAL